MKDKRQESAPVLGDSLPEGAKKVPSEDHIEEIISEIGRVLGQEGSNQMKLFSICWKVKDVDYRKLDIPEITVTSSSGNA